METLSLEEFDKLNDEEQKQALIELLNKVPDEHMKDLYDEIVSALNDFRSGESK